MVHWNTLTTVNGTPHLTLQSLTESFTTAGEPAASTALITINDDYLTYAVAALDPQRTRIANAQKSKVRSAVELSSRIRKG